MEKLFSVLLAAMLFVNLTGCGETADPSVTVQDGAFTCDPQSIIDQINSAIEADGSGGYLVCAPFEKSQEAIFADDSLGRLLLNFSTNEGGYVTKCRLYWSSLPASSSVVSSAGLYATVIVDTLSSENADEILASISDIVRSGGDVEYSLNQVNVKFETIGADNWLDVTIEE